MKKTMMYLPDDMHRFLSEEAERRGTSMAEVAREAISEYRTKSGAAPKGDISAIIGIIHEPGPPTDDARRVDELLDEYYAPGGGWDQEHGFAGPDR